MPLNTASVAVQLTPTVLKTFFKHCSSKLTIKKKRANGSGSSSSDDLRFKQAFHIIKDFMVLTTHNTVEALQSFSNTTVPSVPWAIVSSVLIPLSSCNEAADVLIQWFGPEQLRAVAGGERWWQVRGSDGVHGEWIAQKRDIGPAIGLVGMVKEETRRQQKKLNRHEKKIVKMNGVETVMLYIHGGAYFWGSINTHRYPIVRFARKLHGRVFAVNYRKAPQYPFPCALQDVLAAYLYLIQPPKDSVHSPVPASKIVLAGDSAGGGLCLSVLTVIRDMGLPMPAGAVLISPWVDLTHSFPSVMKNVEKDFLPPYGFFMKPSTVWPVDSLQTRGVDAELEHGGIACTRENEDPFGPPRISGSLHTQHNTKPLKVMMENASDAQLELHSQIQMYATNEQLTHPLVSPLLQGSLCNLCPLFVIAGEDEALRDEVIYMAHRAANPAQYPARPEFFNWSRQEENSKKFKRPTKVKLEVYDGMCHVLTLFPFTTSAKHAFKSITKFVDDVTKDQSAEPGYEGKQALEEIGESLQELHKDGSRNDSEGAPNGADNTPAGLKKTDDVMMVRKRIDLRGKARDMEPPENLVSLETPWEHVGHFQEAASRRWFAGQKLWNKKFDGIEKSVESRRAKNAAKYAAVLAQKLAPKSRSKDRRWHPLDLGEENPPPSAIAKRRDTADSVALLKKLGGFPHQK